MASEAVYRLPRTVVPNHYDIEIVPDLEQAGIRCERLLPRTKLAASPLADVNPSCIFGFFCVRAVDRG